MLQICFHWQWNIKQQQTAKQRSRKQKYLTGCFWFLDIFGSWIWLRRLFCWLGLADSDLLVVWKISIKIRMLTFYQMSNKEFTEGNFMSIFSNQQSSPFLLPLVALCEVVMRLHGWWGFSQVFFLFLVLVHWPLKKITI